MRIGIDAHHINGKPQGSRTYLIQLIRALASVADEDELRVFSFDPDATQALLNGAKLTHHRIGPESARLRIPVVVPAIELWHGLDVFHSQYITSPLSVVPEVVTIHDVLFETHPSLFDGAFSKRSVRLIRRSAERARLVLTVSEFSRREIVDTYKLPADRVVVTPNAVDLGHFRVIDPPPEELRDRYDLRVPFVLSVGRLEPRKNLERLIRAFARMRERIGKDVCLAIAGTSDFRHESILEQAARLPDSSVRFLGAVPDKDLPGLYNLAEALAYPSLAEGFGMPILESMACGTPVLTAGRGALPEVGGDAALLTDPEDEDAIERALARVLTDSTLRGRLREAGLERVQHYSWKETARRTLDAYRLAARF